MVNMLRINQAWFFLNGTGGSRKGEKFHEMIQEGGSQKREGQRHMWTECKPLSIQIKD
jgi:hypothetical protein